MTERPELVFGLVGAIGTDLDVVYDTLKDQLERVDYHVAQLKLSSLMAELECEPWSKLPNRSADDYYERSMDAGDKLCTSAERGDAMAMLALNAIRKLREGARSDSKPRAYVLNSLKRPAEINLLKRLYGPYFFVISVYAPRPARVDRLASSLARSSHKNQSSHKRAKAEELVNCDEKDQREKFGQDVRKTFPQADLFVRSSSTGELTNSIKRFIELLFGHYWHTPSKDEQGMSLAFLARVRSSSPARQVGAANTHPDGRVISIGTNDVASCGGGQYWEGDSNDGRDFKYERDDVSDRMRRNLFADLLDRLKELGMLSEKSDELSQLTSGAKDVSTIPSLRNAQLFDTIDFVRSVHAEAAAILAAPSRTDLAGSILYATTFPCHECARHIVAAGIQRVVYVEPYPKSLVSELYRDSVAIDQAEDCGTKVTFQPFVGIAPSRYSALFDATSKARKRDDGTINKWVPTQAFPHEFGAYSMQALNVASTDELDKFNAKLIELGAISE